jgi:AP-3 complex subunit beta
MAHFYVRKQDRPAIKRMKLAVLTELASRANAGRLLGELAGYACAGDADFAAAAVRQMGITAIRHEAVIPECLAALLKLLSRVEGALLGAVLSVIAELLRRRRGTEDERGSVRALCRKFATMQDSGVRAAILQIVGDLQDVHGECAVGMLKFLAGNFGGLSGEVKLRALALAAKLVAVGTESEVPLYFLKMSESDEAFDIRDRARLLVALLSAPSESLKAKTREMLTPISPPATWTDPKPEREFVIGTLSQFFGRELGGYEALPDWAEASELPADSVRLPPRQEAPSGRCGAPEEEGWEEEDDVDISAFFDGGSAAAEEEADAAVFFD